METFQEIFSHEIELTALQMALRATAVFFIAFALIRIAGRRSFGLRTPIDNIIVILLGAILSRAVVGSSPFIPIIFASLVICILHRIFGWLFTHYSDFGRVVEGEKIILYGNGRFIDKNMKRGLVRKEDIMQAVRKATFSDSLAGIDSIYLEHNGEISITKKISLKTNTHKGKLIHAN
ncbi:DUF421 domain-containing protein [Emticicia sp. BO119]|uniref:DUF421 domain-containing protein n=1 Tax=Emticicia sp. BO119 TaxID=2757768 RepID=UPI0015F0C260|nr:YetF domain-containing protein [Emticicia sp. BO119]MBA4852771.1 DUF421 domain-containing protein [Emticicia sp. BO119]